MKKLRALLAFAFLLLCVPAFAQFNGGVTQAGDLSATGVTGAMATGNSATSLKVGLYQLSWYGTGTRTTCTISIEKASTATGSYTTVGTAQTCTSDGSYSFYLAPDATNAWVHINLSAISGAGNTVHYVFNGFYGTPVVPALAVSGANTITSCGTSSSCATPAAVSTSLKFAIGTQSMSAGTSVSITGIAPIGGAFTSATTFTCTASNANGHAYTSGVEITSASAITLVSGTSNSDSWIWSCIGY